jgi:undecaprenyl-diphosphatase
MEIANYLTPLIMGIVEGATEFLPVSSTGHLIVVGDLLDFNDEKGKLFEIVIQLGAILAVCWEYRRKLAGVAGGLASDSTAQGFVLNLLVAFLPAAILGFLFIKQIKAWLFNPTSVAIALIVGGLVILWVERRERTPRIDDADDMTWRDALLIGCAQAVSLIPGTSRAAATIVGGMLSGLSRKAATQFSFYLSIPTMFAATLYDTYKHRDLLQADDFGVFAVGFVVSFLTALLAVKALLRYISHHNFNAFAWYRIVFGAAVLLYYRFH